MSTKCHVTLTARASYTFQGSETSFIYLFQDHLLHSRFSRAVDVLQNCTDLLRVPPDLSDEVKDNQKLQS